MLVGDVLNLLIEIYPHPVRMDSLHDSEKVRPRSIYWIDPLKARGKGVGNVWHRGRESREAHARNCGSEYIHVWLPGILD
jgi:hypothetical protein